MKTRNLLFVLAGILFSHTALSFCCNCCIPKEALEQIIRDAEENNHPYQEFAKIERKSITPEAKKLVREIIFDTLSDESLLQMTPRSPSSKASSDLAPYANPTALGECFLELADSENYERGTIE